MGIHKQLLHLLNGVRADLVPSRDYAKGLLNRRQSQFTHKFHVGILRVLPVGAL